MIGGLLVGMLVKMVSGLSFMRLTFGRDSGLYRCTVVSLICIDQSVRPHIPTPSWHQPCATICFAVTPKIRKCQGKAASVGRKLYCPKPHQIKLRNNLFLHYQPWPRNLETSLKNVAHRLIPAYIVLRISLYQNLYYQSLTYHSFKCYQVHLRFLQHVAVAVDKATRAKRHLHLTFLNLLTGEKFYQSSSKFLILSLTILKRKLHLFILQILTPSV